MLTVTVRGRDLAIKKFADENPLVYKAQQELDEVIEELDTKLDHQLKKQEHDYLKGYSIYVKTKEKELKTANDNLAALQAEFDKAKDAANNILEEKSNLNAT